MTELRIVAADGIKGSGLERLKEEFGESGVVVRGKYDEEELCADIKNIDAILIRSATKVTAKAIEAAGPRLKVIGRAGVGTDNIDKPAATKHGIIVMNTPSGNTIAAAELAIALLFSTARNIARADALMQQGKWDKKSLVGAELGGKTLGIVGFGRIGSHVARVMKAAGMAVMAYDPFLSDDLARKEGVEKVDLEMLTAHADFVSLHTPLTDDTRNLFDAARLAKMKKGARLVNCARGGIVDEAALAEAVKSGHIAAAGIDVYSKEPMTEGPLFGVKDLTLTPHLGASTAEAEECCGRQLAEQVIAYFKEKRIVNAVNIKLTLDPKLAPWTNLAFDLGRVGAELVNARIEEVELASTSQLGDTADQDLILSALKGILAKSGVVATEVNVKELAAGQDITFKHRVHDAVELPYPHLDLYVRGVGENGEKKVTHLAGTVYPEGIPERLRIVQIDDAHMEVRITPHMLFLRYPDQPGWIGKFGTLLGKHNINIDTMQNGELLSRRRASVVLGLSEAPSAAVLKELREIPGVERAWLVSL